MSNRKKLLKKKIVSKDKTTKKIMQIINKKNIEKNQRKKVKKKVN